LICPPLINQIAAAGALKTGSAYCKNQLGRMQRVHEHALAELQKVNDVCTVTETEGAFYLLLKLHTEKNDLELVKALINNYQVAAIPGCAFGLHDGCYLRLSYGMLDEERAEVAMLRLVKGIKKLC
jgi:aspartate/methionine/tyrosine aminotransferase